MRGVRALAVMGILGLALSGCAGGAGTGAQGTQDAEPTTITISAAASLQRPFDQIAENFQAEHANVRITQISYDGSSTLATQIVEGAPVNVFAAADERNMATVVDASLATDPKVFATNTLVIAVPAGNPGHVGSLKDLAGTTTVLCAPQVPCGAASRRLLDSAGIEVKPASLEQNVSAVLQKVSAGEADAGLVYRTDVIGDDTVRSITPQDADRVVNRYPIAVVENPRASTEQARAAQAFVDYVLSDAGQHVLAAHGFGGAG